MAFTTSAILASLGLKTLPLQRKIVDRKIGENQLKKRTGNYPGYGQIAEGQEGSRACDVSSDFQVSFTLFWGQRVTIRTTLHLKPEPDTM
jgi:hypothetical protein